MASKHGLKQFWKKEHPSAAAEEKGQSRLGSSTVSHNDKAADAAAVAASSKADTHHHRHSLSAHLQHTKETTAKENNTKAAKPSADANNDDQNDDEKKPSPGHKVTRKRSILLNLMLPPESVPIDSQLSLPPIDMYNPNPTVVAPSGPTSSSSQVKYPKKAVGTTTNSWTATKTTTMMTEEQESRTTVHLPWTWSWFGHGPREKGAVSKGHKEQQQSENGDKDTNESLVRSLSVTETKIETVSRTVQAKAWISKLGRSSDDSQDIRQRRRPNGAGAAGGDQDSGSVEGMPGGGVDVGQQDMVGELPQSLQQQQQHQSQTLQQEIIHQEIHNKTRTVSLVSVNVSDIFGFGKCLEVILAMMKAHDQFLSRQPFWLQCVIMTWEGLMMVLILWGLLRIVGLAEIVVWGADDLVRGTLSTVRRVGHAVQLYFAYR